MELKKGDKVAVNVHKDWANAVKSDILHYFAGDNTEESRLFIARIVSVTDPDGLWFESSSEERPQFKQKILVPWPFIFSVRTGAVFESKRTATGFIEGRLKKATKQPKPRTLADYLSKS